MKSPATLLILLMLCALTATGQDVTTGLAGRWTFDEGGGTIVTDSSGHGIVGTLSNMNLSTAWVAGKGRTALKFDGTNDFVDL
ncbi:MAG: hypothetical protein JO317_00570, partial [Verrucomicrobiae bacterium]|nr:hypothetical protein [Verrucomicrobiae bacterium]